MNRSTTYVKFEEIYSTNHRGRKEVRYYLNRRNGSSDLVVIGKQKKLGFRDETSSFSEYRYRYAVSDKSLFSVKLRSRREVIDWLNSLLTEFLWVGPTWTCRKKRKHYEAYTRHGVKVSVQDFVYVLAEEGKRLVAYLDDLYEDSRGNKMAVVRWFHKVDEVNLDLPHNSYNNDKEILFSLCLQDLSVECIDGLATVLSPLHYQNFLKVNSHTSLIPFVCRNLFDNDVIKPFDITQVKGYWNQNIHRLMSVDVVGTKPRKRLRKLVDPRDSSDLAASRDNEFGFKKINKAEGFVSECKHEYKIGSEIEVLSQDSGIRGMWLKAVVIKKHKDKIKVRYQDIKDAADESCNLEEWILSSRVAADDQLGIRERGRMTIRPSRLTKSTDVCLIDVGCIVDAWLHDGWWEGIVVHKESDDRIHVYFPAEKQRSILGCEDLRYSEEWLGNGWKQMKSRADLLGLISCATETNSETTKSHDNASILTGIFCDKENSLENSVVGRECEMIDDRLKKDLVTHLNWKWSTRKRRCYASKNNSLVATETRKHDAFTSLVMSR